MGLSTQLMGLSTPSVGEAAGASPLGDSLRSLRSAPQQQACLNLASLGLPSAQGGWAPARAIVGLFCWNPLIQNYHVKVWYATRKAKKGRLCEGMGTADGSGKDRGLMPVLEPQKVPLRFLRNCKQNMKACL